MVVGSVFGTVQPTPQERPLPDFDARSHALRRFADFLALCEFSRTGDEGGAPVRYRVPRANIFVEQPDDVSRLRFPSLAFIGQRGKHEPYGLGPAALLDDTRDVYGKGTALLDLGEYQEAFTIEVWSSHPAERRSLIAGLTTVLRLDEASQSVTLTLPGYYDRTACFWLNESHYNDDPDIIRGRRRGAVFAELRVQEVALVDAVTLRPIVDVDVLQADDPRTDV